MKNRYTIFVFFLVISLLVPASWFAGVDFIGGGEEGISLYRPFKAFLLSKSVWIDVGTGYPSAFLLPRSVMFLTASFFNLVFSSKLSEMLLFCLLIFLAQVGIYLIAKDIFKLKRFYAVCSALFYVFNLYTLSQVFARYVFAGIYAWSFIPLMIYFSARFVKSRKIEDLSVFVLLNLLAAPMYSHPAYVLVLWLIIGLFVVFQIITAVNKRRILLSYIILFVTWLVVNIWWLYPMVNSLKTAGSNPSVRGWEYDYSTIQGLSRDFTNFDIALLRQKFFFERSGYWQNFYLKGHTLVLSIIVFVIVLFGVIKKGVRNKAALFITFIVGWFLVKGVNDPFGDIFYKNLFSLFPSAGMFRNSYEKLGLVFLIPYTVLFGIGLSTISIYISKKNELLVAKIICLAAFGYLLWPIWRGSVFSPLAHVSVPSYYTDANNYLNTLPNDYRVLSLPFIPGEGVHYVWPSGEYYGLEPSEFLFDRQVISWVIPNTQTKDILNNLTHQINQGGMTDEILSNLGIGYIILHKDIDAKYSGSTSIEKAKNIMTESKSFKLLNTFGELEVYSYEKPVKIISFEGGCGGESISFVKRSPRKYTVRVRDARCGGDLIFRITYDVGWVASIDGKIIPNHDKVFGYANKWAVNVAGNYEIILNYKVWPWE